MRTELFMYILQRDQGQHKCFRPPVVYATDLSKAVVLVLFLFNVASWSLLWGVWCWVLLCSLLFSCFSILLALWSPHWGSERPGLCASRAFVCLFCSRWVWSFFLFLLVSGVGYSLWLWHSLDFSINNFAGRLLVYPRLLVSCFFFCFPFVIFDCSTPFGPLRYIFLHNYFCNQYRYPVLIYLVHENRFKVIHNCVVFGNKVSL